MYFPVCLEVIVHCLMIMSFSGEESHNTRWLGNGGWSSILSYILRKNNHKFTYVKFWIDCPHWGRGSWGYRSYLYGNFWSILNNGQKCMLKTNDEPHENILFSTGCNSSAVLVFLALHHGKGYSRLGKDLWLLRIIKETKHLPYGEWWSRPRLTRLGKTCQERNGRSL